MERPERGDPEAAREGRRRAWEEWTLARRAGAVLMVVAGTAAGYVAWTVLDFLSSVCNEADPGYASASSLWRGLVVGVVSGGLMAAGWLAVGELRRSWAWKAPGILIACAVVATTLSSWPPHWCMF